MTPQCSIEGCEKAASMKTKRRGMCSMHISRVHRHGSTELPPRTTTARPPADHAAEFWRRVTPVDGCWEWQGTITAGNYGRLWCRDLKRAILAHRFSYELLVGPIADGLVINHLCRNTRCVNPAHLEAVTVAENTRYSDVVLTVRSAVTHCKRGHEFTPENTYHYGDGKRSRMCRACVAMRDAQRRRKAKSHPPTDDAADPGQAAT